MLNIREILTILPNDQSLIIRPKKVIQQYKNNYKILELWFIRITRIELLFCLPIIVFYLKTVVLFPPTILSIYVFVYTSLIMWILYTYYLIFLQKVLRYRRNEIKFKFSVVDFQLWKKFIKFLKMFEFLQISRTEKFSISHLQHNAKISSTK